MKRTIVLLFALALMLTVMPIGVFADEAAPEGYTGVFDFESIPTSETLSDASFETSYANGKTTFTFYDNGVSGGLVAFKDKAEGAFCIREYFKLYADGKYTFNHVSGTSGADTVQFDRSVGWHTIVIDTAPDAYDVFFDGKPVHSVKTDKNAGIKYVYVQQKSGDGKVISGSSRKLYYKELKTEEKTGYFDGKGTKEEPYLIKTPKDLATLVYLTTDYGNGYYDTSADYTIPGTTTVWPASGAFGKAGYYCGRYSGPSAIRYYKMTSDIDMSGYDFSKGGIGEGMDFRGSFDGDGHVIKNWTSTSSGGNQTNGIFAVAGFGNVPGQGIRNVGVENASVTSDKFISGVLVGYLSSIGTQSDVAVENCYVKNSSSKIMTRDTAPSNGGVVGCLRFEACSATSMTVKNCYAEGIKLMNSEGSEDGQPDYGGIVARIWHNWIKGNKAYISNCYSLGTTVRDYVQPVGAVPGNNTTATFEYADCYSLSANGSEVWSKWATDSTNNTPSVAETNLSAPTAASFTGGTFVDDVLELNGGLPVFSWEYTYITNTLETPENGTLDVAEETGMVKKSGNTVYIKTGADLAVTAEPSENYTLSAVKYGGEDKTSAFGVSGSAKFAFSDLKENGVWSAEFKENTAEPSIAADKTVTITTYGEEAVPAAVAYAKFSGVNPFEYGMVITRTADGKALALKAADNKNGAYAIKVYGEGVKTGSFTMKPYYVAQEGDAAECGEETDSFTLE